MGLLRDPLAVLGLWRCAAAEYGADVLKQMLQHATTAALFFTIVFFVLRAFGAAVQDKNLENNNQQKKKSIDGFWQPWT